MNSFCHYFNAKTCQSCRFIEIDYSKQLLAKEERLKKSLSHFEGWNMLPSVASRPSGFRNKAKMSVTGTLEAPIIGLSGEKNLDEGREILNCPVHHPMINQLLTLLPEFIQITQLPPYQISLRKGELKSIIAYYSEVSNESYLRFVLRSKEGIDRLKKYLPWLQERFLALSCVSVNIQPIPHAILEGDEEIIITDQKNIRHLLDKIELRLSPKGFVQTNQMMAQNLYQTAANWARDLNTNIFAELFCGQGAFSFFMAPFVKMAAGFEIDSAAVFTANATVRDQGITNMTFKCADAASVGHELKALSPDLLLVNPPRRGLGESISILQQDLWPHVIYSSCSLESLVKDLEALKHLYEIKKVQLFDMFPHTEHFEMLVLLEAKT